MRLNRMIEVLHPASVRGNMGVEVKGIAADSRRIKPGYLFIAVPGERHDGADFITEAKDRGAVGLVLREFSSSVNCNLAQIKVADPRRALGHLANCFFCHPGRRMKMIGVTGTNGKTTVVHLARSVLQGAGISTGLLGTIYYAIGERRLPSELTTPPPPQLQALLAEMVKAGCTHVVMEVSSHAITQQRLAGIEFGAAVFTNLSREHIDYHRTMEDYRDAKVNFLENLHRGEQPIESKTAIINNDDPLSQRILRSIKTPVITYGLSPRADLSASRIRLDRSGTVFSVRWQGKDYQARMGLPGRYNVYNALAMIGLGLSEGIELEAILDSLRRHRGIRGRVESVEAGQDFDLYIDYAHTPDGLENVLGALRELYDRRLIVVFGCGGDRDRSKRSLMGAVAVRLADEIIVTTDNPRTEDPVMIINDILSRLPRGCRRARVVADRRQAIEEACLSASSGDVVLIAGKGHEQKQIFRDRVIPFSDREVAEDVLSKIKGRDSDNTT